MILLLENAVGVIPLWWQRQARYGKLSWLLDFIQYTGFYVIIDIHGLLTSCKASAADASVLFLHERCIPNV